MYNFDDQEVKLQGSLAERSRLYLSLVGPIEADTSSDYANRPPSSSI